MCNCKFDHGAQGEVNKHGLRTASKKRPTLTEPNSLGEFFWNKLVGFDVNATHDTLVGTGFPKEQMNMIPWHSREKISPQSTMGSHLTFLFTREAT